MNSLNAYINGLGIISRCACSLEELALVGTKNQAERRILPLDFPCEVPSSKLRRTSRYSKMACAAADQALKDFAKGEKEQESALKEDCYRFGTIISTGYGACQYSAEFADTVVRGNPSACSPTVFSGSVPNSCVGQICIVNNLKGPSTVLAGGDPLEYAALLLNTKRADHILAGSVEEYYPALYQSVSSFESAKGADLSEGAAMLVLGREKTDNTYCRVSAFSGASLKSSPCLHFLENAAEVMEEVLRDMKQPEVIFTAANGTWFDAEEEKAISRVFPDTARVCPKEYFGETLGASCLMSAAFAALQIRNGKYGSVLLTGTDMIGNYCCALFEKA